MSQYFDNFRVPDLQKYLRNRGVSVTGYNKGILKEIAIAVHTLQLPEDPDYCLDSIKDCVTKKLARVGLSDCNPLEIDGYTSDFTNIPEFGLIDIFNYLIFNRTDYDGKKLKGYKSFDDYRLFFDGSVESLEFNSMDDHKICIFRSKVKPTQRDKTYLNKEFYDLWIILDKEDGYVVTAHCECKGGTDGACRHIAAALYELEAFEKKSCTEGDNQWAKRPRHHDIPVPIRDLTVIKAKYASHGDHTPMKPHIDLFDPRLDGQREDLTDEKKREFALKLQEVSQNAQALDVLLQPEDRVSVTDDDSFKGTVSKLSILNKAQEFVNSNSGNESNVMCKKFHDSLICSGDDVSAILEATEGQAVNKLWNTMRIGMLTASNFAQACSYMEKQKDPSNSFIKSIMGENQICEQFLPKPLKWGRRKEPIARLMYTRLCRREHFSLKVQEKGFLVCQEHPTLGCSVDGIVLCKCKHHLPKILEIKCPYASRDMLPKDVAVEKNLNYNRQSGKWEVTNNCPYYSQIQGQMGLYGLSECDLVIYTKKGIHISTATFDGEYFSDMLEKLLLFHEKYIIPCILAKVLSK